MKKDNKIVSLILVGFLSSLMAVLATAQESVDTVSSEVDNSTVKSTVKTLNPESKQSLKKMVQMTGKIEKTCDDADPDVCLGASVDKSTQVLVKSKDSLTVKSAALSKELPAEPASNDSEKSPRLQAQDGDLITSPDITLVRADERAAIVRSLTQECRDQKMAASCKRLAVISKEMNKPRAAIQLYKLACENGDVLLCKELARKLNKMGKKDLASLYLEKACIHGDQNSCVVKVQAPSVSQ